MTLAEEPVPIFGSGLLNDGPLTDEEARLVSMSDAEWRALMPPVETYDGTVYEHFKPLGGDDYNTEYAIVDPAGYAIGNGLAAAIRERSK